MKLRSISVHCKHIYYTSTVFKLYMKYNLPSLYPSIYPHSIPLCTCTQKTCSIGASLLKWFYLVRDTPTRYCRCGKKSYSIIFSRSSPWNHFSTRDLFRQLVCLDSYLKRIPGFWACFSYTSMWGFMKLSYFYKSPWTLWISAMGFHFTKQKLLQTSSGFGQI